MGETFDVAVVGAGLVGLASARALLGSRSCSVAVLEAEDRPAAHQSGHNSGVIHSGLYYRPGSLKARLCFEGREDLERYCEEHDVPWERCGKVVVATSKEQLGALDELERRGAANGLDGIQRLGPEGLRDHEPHVRGVEGLFVPHTGIVDYVALARAYAREVEQQGGSVLLRQAAGAIHRDGDSWRIETPKGELRARHLLNCAGANSDRVARRAGLRPKARIVPFRGEYKLLSEERSHLVRHLIYPVPQRAGLGIHLTLDLAGRPRFGPDATYVAARDEFEVDAAKASVFAEAAARYLPDLAGATLVPDYGGIRPKLAGPGEAFRDFVVEEGTLWGAPGFIGCLGIESPGLTSSLALAERVAGLVAA